MTLKNLKFTSETKQALQGDTIEQLRSKLLSRLEEQRELVEADISGTTVIKTRQVARTNDAGERVIDEVPRKLRKWYWHNICGVWFIEVRYGNKALMLDGKSTAIEIASREKLLETIDVLKKSTIDGELDEALLTVKKKKKYSIKTK